MAESFDAVLAEMRLSYNKPIATSPTRLEFADRLQSAHEAEVAVRDARVADLQAALYRWVPRADHGQQAADDATLLIGMTECPADEPGEAMRQRADRAVALLRRATMRTSDEELKAQVTAFLSEQAGERENGDG